MTVAAILEKRDIGEIITIAPDAVVREAVALLATRRIGAVPVVQGGDVVGIMSERDVIYNLEREGAIILDWTVAQIMTAPAITVDRAKTVLSALSLMTKRRIRHLPVVENGRLIGIVSIGDLVKHRMDAIETDAQQMLNYIQGT